MCEVVVVDDSCVFEEIKPQRQRKSTAGGRKILHIWTDDEIISLISSVEKHRGLWDYASPEYKLTRLNGWQSVADELGIEGVDANEAKVKWSSLRTTYMVNLAKLRKKKSGQGANESHTVVWKFFKALMFLESNNIQHSTSSTSTLNLESDDSNRSLLAEFMPSSSPSQSESTFCSQRKRSRPVTSSSPSKESSKSSAISILNTAVAALHSSDTNSAFCDHLLAELKTLSDARSRELRYKISRLMMDFMETIHQQTPISSVPNLIQNGQDPDELLSSDMLIETEE